MKKIQKPIVLMLILTILFTMLSPMLVGGATLYRTSISVATSQYQHMGNWAYPNRRVNIHMATVNSGAYQGAPVYCMEFGKDMGETGQGETVMDIEDVPAWQKMSVEQQNGVTWATIYGYPNFTYGVSAEAARIATQLIIWEYTEGFRTSADGNNPTAGLNGYASNGDYITSILGYDVRERYYRTGACAYPEVLTAYKGILNGIKNHRVVPSFQNNTLELKWNSSSKRYEAKITDSNQVLSNFNLSSSNSNLKFQKSGNTLIVYTTAAVPAETNVRMTKPCTEVGANVGYVPDDKAENQSLVGMLSDPVPASSFKVKTASGNLHLKKTSEDGDVSGIPFTITGNGLTYERTTDNKGEFTLNNIPEGTYTVTEHADNKYVQNKSQTVTVRVNQTAEVKFHNILKKFSVEVTKKDSEKGKEQGNATLQGAVYGLYNNGELVKEYTTDDDGKFTTDYEICGSKWTLKELIPSEGYNLDKTVHEIPAGAENFKIELNTIKKDVYEPVIKGTISIIKHVDGESQIETPEEGAEFQVYLKSAGSYDKANPDERDILVCNEYGFAKTKDLPYGTYTVHQTKAWEGKKFLNDFDIFISENNKEYPILAINPTITSYLKIVKADAETHKTITRAGTGYQIYDPDGKLISMKFTYPTPTTIDTFYTDENGCLVTPEKLSYGKGYKLVEVQAPYGYVIDRTPIIFDVTAENSVNEDGITIITVTQENTAQKGVIEISKTGEVFASVKNNDEVYTPIYEEQGLADAEFEIYADEDIVTADGTVRAKQGELVDTIVTDSNGTAKSKLLYLGEYTVKETKAPYTFALNNEEQHLALTYEGQEISTISRSVSFYDQRQTSGIELTKVLEQNELYKVGMNDEVQNVKFSVYAAEEVTAQDGEIIPANGLITTASVTADNTLTFDCDLPVGYNWYVQETETDEHYIISDEKYNFSTEYQGQDVERHDIKINDGEGILNLIKNGVVNGKKLDDSGNPLNGALIGIFFDTAEEFTKDTAITTVMSADDGTFSFTDIPVGTYIVKEIEAPKDYLLDEKSYIVEITENEQTVELELVNVLKRGSIHGIKIDNLSNPLEGALIGLFSADTTKFTKKNALMTATSDKEGNFEFNNLPVGKYIVKELKAPKGYILNEKVYEVTIEENEQIIELKIVNEAEVIEVKSPMTGADYAILFTSLAAVMCTAAAITVFLKKRKEKNEGTNLHQI